MFRNPWYLAALLAACGAAAAAHFRAGLRRKDITRQIGEARTLARLVPAEIIFRRRLKAGLQLAALALLFIALAGPQWGVELVATNTDARQVFVAVDVSASMAAEDTPPNRLEKAKRELSLLLDSLKGDRVGVIAFAGSAAVLCPITSDVEAAKQILSSLSFASIPEPGTAIGSAVRLALGALNRYSGGRAIVLLTDGEDHNTDPLGAANEAAAAGVRLYAVGIGTADGAPLPIKEENSAALLGYKKDKGGQTVISRLGEKTLAEMAARTGGAYWRATASDEEVGDIMRQIESLERSQGARGSSARYRNRFLFPLALALILLTAELLVPLRGPIVCLALALLCLPRPALAGGRESALREGNRFYSQRRYQDALARYGQAHGRADPRPDFNSGDALYRLEDYDRSEQLFRSLAGNERLPRPTRASAYYNLGNVSVRKEDYRAAVDAYRKAVTLAPDDADARHNLAVALRMLRNPPPPKPKCNKPKPNQPQPKGGKSDSPQPNPPPQQQPAPRPQDRVSRDEAERIMRAVAEKEKSGARKAAQRLTAGDKRRPPAQEDW